MSDTERVAKARLTERERECLALVYHQLGSKEIALNLGLSSHTIDGHLRAALRKLGVSSRRQAARMLMGSEPPQPLTPQALSIPSRAFPRAEPALPDEKGTPRGSNTWVARDVLSERPFVPIHDAAPADLGTTQPVGSVRHDLAPTGVLHAILRMALVILIATVLAVTCFEALDRVVSNFHHHLT